VGVCACVYEKRTSFISETSSAMSGWKNFSMNERFLRTRSSFEMTFTCGTSSCTMAVVCMLCVCCVHVLCKYYEKVYVLCVAVYCSVLQCVAVCCSVLQCVAGVCIVRGRAARAHSVTFTLT